MARPAGWKRYIGDGVYVNFDGLQLIVTTEDGIGTTNEIYLEESVWKSLKEYAEEIEKETGWGP